MINNSIYKDKGLTGLSNLGNTCFINSCMQIISHTYELNNLLNHKNIRNKIKNIYESNLIIEWDDLRKMMWKNNCVISPGKFIRTIQQVSEFKKIEMFTGYSQNDLPEFLLFVIDCFHNSLSREIQMKISGNIENLTDKIAIQCFEMIQKMYSKDYSEIWNLFYAIHITELKNLETNEIVKLIPEPYFMINLSIPSNNKSPSLIDCLNFYVEDEILEGENSWYNENTKEKINIKKKIQFWSFPNVLVFDFKRFNNNFQKNKILITFPIEELDLSNYVIGYKKNSYKYELYGVCNHSGGVIGGHYTCYVKNANNKWYHYNDTIVSEIETIHSIITEKAYVLFYRLKYNNI
jgi:ubiquitin carboxyl-terminal hydrolase 8